MVLMFIDLCCYIISEQKLKKKKKPELTSLILILTYKEKFPVLLDSTPFLLLKISFIQHLWTLAKWQSGW